MKRIFVTALLVLLAAPAAIAQSDDPADYLDVCPVEDEGGWCAGNQTMFAEALPGAYLGDYQDVRNVAYCLATGCDGAVRIDRREACAWRSIAYGLAPTGDEKILETQTMEAHCAGVSQLEVRAFLDAILQRVEG